MIGKFRRFCLGKKKKKNELVAIPKEEVESLKLENEDLSKQVEGLQNSKSTEDEESVYLRWVNACLRYELRNYPTPSGMTSARDLSKRPSPRSQATAKRLVLQYTGNDAETESSCPSFTRGHVLDDDSNDSSPSRFSSSRSRTRTSSRNRKRWWKSNDDSSTASSPPRSIGETSGCRTSNSSKASIAKGPLEEMRTGDTSDEVAITTFGKAEDDSNGYDLISASFKLMSQSDEGELDERYFKFVERRKNALERWKKIRKKAYQARSKSFGDGKNLNTTSDTNIHSVTMNPNFKRIQKVMDKWNLARNKPDQTREISSSDGTISDINSNTRAKEQSEQPVTSEPKLTQTPEKVVSDSDEQRDQNKVNAPTAGEKKPTSPKPSGGAPLPPPPGKGTAQPSRPPTTGPPGMPPPPPPPGKGIPKGPGAGGNKVHRAPELVEFYHSLMKREQKKDTTSVGSTASNASDARNNMIEEIQNKSSYLIAVKSDVENHGDFVKSLANKIRTISFTKMEDVVSFVNWLDEELSILVDERAVLKHFEWPEKKADALREAAFEYQDIAKLEKQVSSFDDDPKLSFDAALKRMYSMLEKIENSVYALLRTRDMAVSRFKESGIPVDWLSDSGVVGKIKLLSIQLAKKFMIRGVAEIDGSNGSTKGQDKQSLLLQGVRFAFRVHQFAGGFDAESMEVFKELRSRVSPPPGHTNR